MKYSKYIDFWEDIFTHHGDRISEEFKIYTRNRDPKKSREVLWNYIVKVFPNKDQREYIERCFKKWDDQNHWETTCQFDEE